MLLLPARRNDLLQQVAENIRKKYSVNVLALNFDVRDKEAVTDHIRQSFEMIGKI